MSESSLLIKFLKTVETDCVEDIYSSPFACLVVFRELPTLSKHVILRILFIDETVRKNLIESWVNKECSEFLEECLVELVNLRLFSTNINGPQGAAFRLQRRFQDNLKSALFGGRKVDIITEYYDENLKPDEPGIILKNASEKWEGILSVVAGCPNEVRTNNVVSLVINDAGYVSGDMITSEGFQFLLLPIKKQMWKFLICYLDYMKKHINVANILPSICQMGFGSLHQLYTFTNPSSDQMELLQHLNDFGFIRLVHRQNIRPVYVFQPTQLLIDLIAGQDRPIERNESMASSMLDTSGYIIMESSDLIYAKTSSKLQTAVLNMFCDVEECFPGCVICRITDASISKAIEKGITSNQIIEFLRNNAHPEMKDESVVPISLIDKIKMVEINRKRVKATSAYAYHTFNNNKQFERLIDYAESLGQQTVLWKNREKQFVVVPEESHKKIRRYWKTVKQNDP